MRMTVIAALILFASMEGFDTLAHGVDIDPTTASSLATIESTSGPKRFEAAARLSIDLSNAFNNGQKISGALRDNMCTRLITVYRTLGSSSDDVGTKQQIAGIESGHCNSAEAKQFVFHLMDTEPANIRGYVLTYVGGREGLRDSDVYSKINEWSDKGYIKKSARPAYWAKLKGKNSVSDILQIITTTQDRDELVHAAWALQGVGSFQDMKIAFRRAKELHLEEPVKDGPNGLYWVKSKTLIDYVKNADGSDLDNILELMVASSALTPTGIVPVLLNKLQVATGETEKLLIQRLMQAADNPRIDHDQVAKAFSEKLSTESDSKIKEQLRQSLKDIAAKKSSAQKFRNEEQEWIKKNRK